jgi:hypothetical protein
MWSMLGAVHPVNSCLAYSQPTTEIRPVGSHAAISKGRGPKQAVTAEWYSEFQRVSNCAGSHVAGNPHPSVVPRLDRCQNCYQDGPLVPCSARSRVFLVRVTPRFARNGATRLLTDIFAGNLSYNVRLLVSLSL